MAFALNKKPEGAKLTVEVTGNVDEDANFQPVDVGSATADALDLNGVTAINSV